MTTHFYPPPQKIILEETAIMGGFINLRIIAQNTLRSYLGVGIMQLVLLMVICLLFPLCMVKVVWVLGLLTITPIKLIVGLMLEFLCHQGVGNINFMSHSYQDSYYC